MRLIDDAKKVLKQSWSVRLSVAAAVAGTLAQFQDQLPLIQAYVPHGWMGPLSIACAMGATLARVLHQERMHE